MLQFYETRLGHSPKKEPPFERRPKSTGRRHKDWKRDPSLTQPETGYSYQLNHHLLNYN